MAKVVKQTNNGEVAAALSHIEDTSMKNAKYSDTLKSHIVRQDEDIYELEAKLKDAEKELASTKATEKERYLRDMTVFQARVAALEEKLRKVQATLA